MKKTLPLTKISFILWGATFTFTPQGFATTLEQERDSEYARFIVSEAEHFPNLDTDYLRGAVRYFAKKSPHPSRNCAIFQRGKKAWRSG